MAGKYWPDSQLMVLRADGRASERKRPGPDSLSLAQCPRPCTSPSVIQIDYYKNYRPWTADTRSWGGAPPRAQ